MRLFNFLNCNHNLLSPSMQKGPLKRLKHLESEGAMSDIKTYWEIGQILWCNSRDKFYEASVITPELESNAAVDIILPILS